MLTVNVGAAALPRAEKLLAWLTARPEDVFLLTETSSGPGTAYLMDSFRASGYAVEHTPDSAGERGAAIVSKVPFKASLSAHVAGISLPGRVAFVRLDTEPATALMAVYVPSRDRSIGKTERKQLFLASLTDTLDRLPTQTLDHLIIGGDYNVISRDHEPRYPGFLDFEYSLLERLERHSLVDAHRRMYPGQQVHSWIGRTGDGYRYDYFHVGTGLAERITDSEYLHETRDIRLTDHAAVTLSVDLNVPARLATTDPIDNDTDVLSLF